jgi:hypothetical protein
MRSLDQASHEARGSTGIGVAASGETSTRKAVAEIRRELGPGPFQHLIVFFSKRRHNASTLSAELADAFPDVVVSGCSTAGEITPAGMTQGGLVAFAFPVAGFQIYSDVIETASIEDATAVTRRLLCKAGVTNTRVTNEGLFAILLTDGVSNREEFVVGAVSWELNSIPLVGGSAGDDEFFESTDLIHSGSARNKVAILIVGKTKFPFRTFSVHNLRPKPVKLVVTRADPENRIVAELNAEPAATEYANAIGIDSEQLGPLSFASYPLAVKVGENYYCRSILKVNPDSSLLFACAVDEGLVFTAAYPHNIVESTEDELESIKKNIGDVDVVLGFDCLFRRLDAESHQCCHLLEKLYKQYNVIGFHTYGEQFNGLHLNQTLTGIAFAPRK